MNRLKYNTFLKTDESLKNKVDFILEDYYPYKKETQLKLKSFHFQSTIQNSYKSSTTNHKILQDPCLKLAAIKAKDMRRNLLERKNSEVEAYKKKQQEYSVSPRKLQTIQDNYKDQFTWNQDVLDDLPLNKIILQQQYFSEDPTFRKRNERVIKKARYRISKRSQSLQTEPQDNNRYVNEKPNITSCSPTTQKKQLLSVDQLKLYKMFALSQAEMSPKYMRIQKHLSRYQQKKIKPPNWLYENVPQTSFSKMLSKQAQLLNDSSELSSNNLERLTSDFKTIFRKLAYKTKS